MKKSAVNVNAISKTIEVSKAFYKKASTYGTNEYRELHSVMMENANYTITIKTIEKQTYHALTFKLMEDYIKTQTNSAENLIEFIAVQKIAKAKGSIYPYTKKWFLDKFPEYKGATIQTNEDVKGQVVKEMRSNANSKIEAEASTDKQAVA